MVVRLLARSMASARKRAACSSSSVCLLVAGGAVGKDVAVDGEQRKKAPSDWHT